MAEDAYHQIDSTTTSDLGGIVSTLASDLGGIASIVTSDLGGIVGTVTSDVGGIASTLTSDQGRIVSTLSDIGGVGLTVSIVTVASKIVTLILFASINLLVVVPVP